MAIVFAPIQCAPGPMEEPPMVGFACQMGQQGSMHFSMECPGTCPMPPQHQQHVLDPAATTQYPMQCSSACPVGCQVPDGAMHAVFAGAANPQSGPAFFGMAGDTMLAMVGCTTTLQEQQSAPMPMQPLGIVAEQPRTPFGFSGVAQQQGAAVCFDDSAGGGQAADQQQLWAAYGWGEEDWAPATSGSGRASRRRRRHRGGQDGRSAAPIPPSSCGDDRADASARPAAAAAGDCEGLGKVSLEDFPPLCFARLPAAGKGRIERKPGGTTRTSSIAAESTEAESDSGASSAGAAPAAAAPVPSFLAGSAAIAGAAGAMALAENAELCAEVLSRLGSRLETEEVLAWVLADVPRLALAHGACRVVQKLLEAVSADGRDELAKRLSPWTVELYESPHGNHVLAKLVEVMPSASLRPIVERIEQKGYLAVARHQFGCRILERLIEYGTEAEMRGLNDDFVGSAEQLCRHPYGNFVVQHLLEHGAAHRGAEVVRRLLPTISQLAMHRTASHVVQQALRHASEDGRHAIAAGLLWSAAGKPLLEVAASRYGSYVVEDLQHLCCPGADQLLQMAKDQLLAAGPEQLHSSHFHRVAQAFNLGFVAPPGVVLPRQEEHEEP